MRIKRSWLFTSQLTSAIYADNFSKRKLMLTPVKQGMSSNGIDPSRSAIFLFLRIGAYRMVPVPFLRNQGSKFEEDKNKLRC